MAKPQTDVDRILAWYFDRENNELDPRLKEKLLRLEFAADQFREWSDKSKTVRLVMAKYDLQKSQAYQLVTEAMQLFAMTNRQDKEFIRALLHDIGMKIMQKAYSAGKLKEAAAMFAQLIKIHGLDREDVELPDFSQLQPVPISIGNFPELLNVPLPDNLEEELAKVLAKKRAPRFNSSAAEDAEVVNE
ncbi:MAG: hypothetical protein C0424_10320 [Sphingobacteriaceae bacterium]|nr:hypothetical protein [Sphingobacteriaceae bacterium]